MRISRNQAAFLLPNRKMKYPNLRYGNPLELEYYVGIFGIKIVAKRIRRTERSVRNWIAQRQKMPFWVTELLRLQDIEQREMLNQMNIRTLKTTLGIVVNAGKVVEFKKTSTPQQLEPQAIRSKITILEDRYKQQK
jgi:hypothetical protein